MTKGYVLQLGEEIRPDVALGMPTLLG